MSIFIKLFSLIVFVLVSNLLYPQISGSSINIITSLPILNLNYDATTGGMGEARIATSPDAYSGFNNISKQVFNTKNLNIGATYNPLFTVLGVNDISLTSFTSSYKFKKRYVLAFQAKYMNLGSLRQIDNNGRVLGDIRAYEVALDVGFAFKLSQKFSVGTNIRYINSSIANGFVPTVANPMVVQPANVFAFDVNAFFSTAYKGKDNVFNAGIAITNLGNKVKYNPASIYAEYIPAKITIGSAYLFAINRSNKVSIALDLSKYLVPSLTGTDLTSVNEYYNQSIAKSWLTSFADAPGGFSEELQEIIMSSGLEYNYQDFLIVRTGYHYESVLVGDRKYMTLGFGLRFLEFGLDFSYILPLNFGVNIDPLGNSVRISIFYNK